MRRTEDTPSHTANPEVAGSKRTAHSMPEIMKTHGNAHTTFVVSEWQWKSNVRTSASDDSAGSARGESDSHSAVNRIRNR